MSEVVLVGAGALGSHVALFARNWKHALTVVDHDRVEQRNLLAQVHGQLGLGRNKAVAMKQTLDGLWRRQVTAIPHKLTADNAFELLGGSALVLDCTDNLEARLVTRQAARELAVPCLHGAVSADAQFARVVWDELFEPDPEGAPGAPTCEDGAALPFFGVVGAWMAGVAQAFLESGARASYHLTPRAVIRVA